MELQTLKQHLEFYGIDSSEGKEIEIEKGSREVLSEYQWNDLQVKHCFRNSALLTLSNENFEYCIGYSFKMIPMEHAWIRCIETGKYFDPTWEKFSNCLGEMYLVLKTFKTDEISEILESNENFAPDIFYLVRNGFLKTVNINEKFKNGFKI